MNQDNPTPYGTKPPSEAPAGQLAAYRVYRPYVTYTLLGICVVVFLLQLATQSFLGTDIPSTWGIKANDLILQGQIWRLITPTFLHGSIFHIAFNMYALFYLGSTLERFYRHCRAAGSVSSLSSVCNVYSPGYLCGGVSPSACYTELLRYRYSINMGDESE